MLAKGGEGDDDDPDLIPEKLPEIDEAFSLDGWRIGPGGFFVIYNAGDFGFTGLEPFLIPNPDWQFFLPESSSNMRFLNGASFAALHIPSTDTPSKLKNEGSSTYLLVRKRPLHSLNASGSSVYEPGYAWRKDTNQDADLNSRLDFGDEDTLGVDLHFTEPQTAPLMFEPVQIVDEIAWSNAGGMEYNLPGRGDNAGKISETPGFNPDVVIRTRFLTVNPLLGSRVQGDGDLVPASLADENWLYGETLNLDPGLPEYGTFKALYEPGPDAALGTLDDEMNRYAPTDPLGPTYSYDGPGDVNPMTAPFLEYSAALDPSGSLLFNPYNSDAFQITPGAFNDAPSASPLFATSLAEQFRFVEGDLNFDGVVDTADLEFAEAHLGAGLDDQIQAINNRNTPDPSDDTVYTAWEHQLEQFNAVLMLVRMDLTDGTTGEWNSGVTVTQADIDAVRALLPQCSPADLAEPFGTLDFSDVIAFLSAFGAMDPPADLASPFGVFDFSDVLSFLTAYGEGCP